jgi:transcriptional regulator with XRE-family HTH domain
VPKSLGERIKVLRGDVPQAEFAKKYGLSKNTLWSYENGTTDPKTSFLVQLVTDFGVSADWLLFGVGDPPKPELDAREAILVDHFRHCDERGKDAMITAGSALAQQTRGGKNVDCDDDQKAV